MTKSATISELRDAIWGVSITTDCWTLSATQSYMTVTAHFVTKTHKLKSYVLQTAEVSEIQPKTLRVSCKNVQMSGG